MGEARTSLLRCLTSPSVACSTSFGSLLAPPLVLLLSSQSHGTSSGWLRSLLTSAGMPLLCQVRAEWEDWLRDGGHLRGRPLVRRWGSVAALRLTCHEIKNAVDRALGGGLSQLGVSQLELERFLVGNLFSNCTAEGGSRSPEDEAGRDDNDGHDEREAAEKLLPLLSNSAEAFRAKECFGLMAGLTVGAVQARLAQSRYCIVHCSLAHVRRNLDSLEAPGSDRCWATCGLSGN
jgi:hypothetical protein